MKLKALIASLALLMISPLAQAQTGDRIRDLELAAPTVRFANSIRPSGDTTTQEDADLAKALKAYSLRGREDDASAIEAYLSAHPQSGWSTSLYINLGDLQLMHGFFTRALLSWEAGWALGDDSTDRGTKLLVDHAIGQIAQMRQSFGQFDEVDKVFKRIEHRHIEGAATEKIQGARDVRRLADKDPRHLYVCGPVALRTLFIENGGDPAGFMDLELYRATPKGTSLAELSRMASERGMDHVLVKWRPGQKTPAKALVHWRGGHFATVVGQEGDWVRVKDPAFPSGMRMSIRAFEEEASGYMLVPSDAQSRSIGPWQRVEASDVADVTGKGPVQWVARGGAGDVDGGASDRPGCPLCGSNIKSAAVAITISDTPVGYAPATGPSIFATIAYNQRNDWQTTYMPYVNFGQKWTFSWNRFIDQGTAQPGAGARRTGGDGTQYEYLNYNATTMTFAPQTTDGSILRALPGSPTVYELTTADGTVETYGLSDGGSPYRRTYITSIRDPQGNAVTFQYDGVILKSVTDQYGRKSLIETGANQKVTKITDPFGRSAVFTYDSLDRLSSMTDVLGLTSSFTYDANSLVNSMTTPYGTTTYRYGSTPYEVQPRFAEIEDPLGNRMREEWIDEVIPHDAPAGTVPTGMSGTPKSNYLEFRNTFHWSKDAYAAAGCTSTGGCDYEKARVTHFTHVEQGVQGKATAIESFKQPLENRVFMLYPGQYSSTNAGTSMSPSSIGRVVEGGVSQVGNMTYDTAGYFKPLTITDPVGRVTTYEYAPNHIDLLSVKRTVAAGAQETLMQATYDGAHNPLTVTDAAGQVSATTYNAKGQPLTVTNALNEVTSFAYDALGRLTTVTNANNVVSATYTYDALDRVATATDSEGWTVAYEYDAANRQTKVTYPDGTFERYVYDRLDLVAVTDRLKQTTSFTHDANSRVTSKTDPQGRTIHVEYTPDGNIAALIDAKGNRTEWTYDIQSRPIQKKYADNSTVTYAYGADSGRLVSETDALGQVKQYAYTADDQIANISYANAVNPTAAMSLVYDIYYRRPTAMTDGIGTTTYSYKPVGTNGALQIASETGPLLGASISYGYDALGRPVSRTIAGATPETYGHDALGRLTSHVNGLGTFTYAYLGQTAQMTSKSLGGTSLSSTWSYGSNLQDRRLTGMTNAGLVSGEYVDFGIETDILGRLTNITQNTDVVIPSTVQTAQTGQFNALNQQTLVGTQINTYDVLGQLTFDGMRNYSWDAEGQLIGITYPAEPGKSTLFSYDGMGRRVGILSTPAGGGSALDRRFVWCGSDLCQSRDPTGLVLRDYLAEGEKTGAQSFYYAQDHQGSVRRAFTTSASPAYDYDPYGTQIQTGAPVTDFTYAGLMALPEAGIYLSQTRPYNPGVGRWLRRDMAGESADADGNLYGYADRNPVNLVDPDGRNPLLLLMLRGAAIGALGDGLGSLLKQMAHNGGKISCTNWDTVATDAALGGVKGALGVFRGASTVLALVNRAERVNDVLDVIASTPDPKTGIGYGVNDPPVRIQGDWTRSDIFNALEGRSPKGLGSPQLHHADQMPGSAIHEILEKDHLGNKALHPNKWNQGVTKDMRWRDAELHWWYRAQEEGAWDIYPDHVYGPKGRK